MRRWLYLVTLVPLFLFGCWDSYESPELAPHIVWMGCSIAGVVIEQHPFIVLPDDAERISEFMMFAHQLTWSHPNAPPGLSCWIKGERLESDE